MADDVLSLRVIVVSPSPSLHETFREAAAKAQMPIDLVASERELTAVRSLATGADLAFFDSTLGDEAVALLARVARAAPRPPLTIALTASGDAVYPTDALATKPADFHDARRLLAGATRLRLPSRLLLVDDSSTMRSIVRKVLSATRVPLDVTEADQGGEALALARAHRFDFVLFDYNLPGLSGLEAIAEFRRARRYPAFILMTSVGDATLPDKARAQGVTFLKKPFYPADIEAILFGLCGLRAVHSQAAESRPEVTANPIAG
jgi:CheY-like chemotaxis protein